MRERGIAREEEDVKHQEMILSDKIERGRNMATGAVPPALDIAMWHETTNQRETLNSI